MASLSRKRQDEKNQTILRYLASLPHNKYCFDCNQRGPTYVNVTIGSFVCTKCSGLLRGLPAPHRVKSISMATFTPEEVELIRSRGNEYCQRMWLGLYESNVLPEFRNEHAVRDFMVDKYDRKLYYLENNNATVKEAVMEKKNLINSKTIDPYNAKTFPHDNGNLIKPDGQTIEFVADFNSADIYNAAEANNVHDTRQSCAFFANFDDFPWANQNNSNSNGQSQNGHISVECNGNRGISAQETAQAKSIVSSSTVDRYAALEDLDNAFKSCVNLDWNWSFNDSSNNCLNSSSTSSNSLQDSSSSNEGVGNNGVNSHLVKNPFNSCLTDVSNTTTFPKMSSNLQCNESITNRSCNTWGFNPFMRGNPLSEGNVTNPFL